jgi:hypothetical protein
MYIEILEKPYLIKIGFFSEPWFEKTIKSCCPPKNKRFCDTLIQQRVLEYL